MRVIPDFTSNHVMCHISKLYYKAHFHLTGLRGMDMDSSARNSQAYYRLYGESS